MTSPWIVCVEKKASPSAGHDALTSVASNTPDRTAAAMRRKQSSSSVYSSARGPPRVESSLRYSKSSLGNMLCPPCTADMLFEGQLALRRCVTEVTHVVV